MDFQQHHILVERPPSQDGLGRESGSAQVVYDGNAEIQERAVTKTSTQGGIARVGDARGWLPDGTELIDAGIQQGDSVTVTRPDGSTFEATVATTTPLDDSFVLSKDRST
jgi:hypothetical protein